MRQVDSPAANESPYWLRLRVTLCWAAWPGTSSIVDPKAWRVYLAPHLKIRFVIEDMAPDISVRT